MRKTNVERFWTKFVRSGSCWLWIGARDVKSGYGTFWDGHGTRKAHRYSYELLVGPIPSGLQIDHLCRTRACVNPSHLEPVTSQVNLLRGDTFQSRNAAKTHCPAGHPYDEENTYFYRGWRRCRACGRELWQRKRARRSGATCTLL